MPVNGFNGDYELSIGSAIGVRAFKVDWLGRLTGVTQTDQVFRPGTNKATCWKCDTDRMERCECGFYAYFKGQDNSFLKGESVGGIIEGTGRTIIGTKGFRTENAKLLALFPIRDRHLRRFRATSWTRWLYPTGEWFDDADYAGPLNLIASALLTVAVLMFGTVSLFTSDWELGTWLVPLGLYFLGWARRATRAMQSDLLDHMCWPKERTKQEKKSDPFIRIKKIYPDVPVYRSMRAAVKDFPLSPAEAHVPELPSPETTDNFWELSADERTRNAR